MLPRDYQLDVVTDRPVHVDFFRRIARACASACRCTSRTARLPRAWKKGGALNLGHTVEVMAPADDIPELLTIDLAGLDFHDSGACLGPEIARRLQAGRLQG